MRTEKVPTEPVDPIDAASDQGTSVVDDESTAQVTARVRTVDEI